ncbi:MAG: RsmE family RNA methyltransferase [Candidatus Gastranaerophilales bacterium]|nr:RsmE family RNA methyltransferase [Candidatus Gastranaerophilales bacterium]
MPQFFIQQENIINNTIFVTNKSDINHIHRILRLGKCDKLILSDKNSIIYETEIIRITENSIETRILQSFKSNRILKTNITLAQSILKSVKQDIIIQKATELGVNTIIPLITRNTVVKFANERDKNQKIQRWQKISYEASKQCQRPGIPQINPILSLDELVTLDNYDIKFVCAERDAASSIKEFLSKSKQDNPDIKNILIIIGPEGGWDNKEVALFRENNIAQVTLGNLILRAETAAITAISDVVYEYEL